MLVRPEHYSCVQWAKGGINLASQMKKLSPHHHNEGKFKFSRPVFGAREVIGEL